MFVTGTSTAERSEEGGRTRGRGTFVSQPFRAIFLIVVGRVSVAANRDIAANHKLEHRDDVGMMFGFLCRLRQGVRDARSRPGSSKMPNATNERQADRGASGRATQRQSGTLG